MDNKYINDNEVLKAINTIVETGHIFELRILNNSKKNDIRSGYFKDPDTALAELKKQNLNGCNVYIVLNSINEACSARQQQNRFIFGCTTTSDNDIAGRDWLPIDIDPVRPAGTSSSNEELKEAFDVANKVFNFLDSQGFNRPVIATSGNGWHLLYKVALANTPENKELVSRVLKNLNAFFGNEKAKVDVANSNAARIFKLYGTVAQKGLSTEDRPHRMSYIKWMPKDIQTTDKAMLEKIAHSMDAEPEKKEYNRHDPKHFDLGEWLDRYGIEYEIEENKDYTKYILPVCPFNEQHTGKDACLFQFSNGAICFKCFHDSCQDHTWQELRQMYEPDAYERKQAYQKEKMYQTFNRDAERIGDTEPEADEPEFYTFDDIMVMEEEPEHFIKSGFTEFDKKYKGFKKGCVTALSGYTGGAKSTILSQMVLNAINQGNKVAVFSGELTAKDYGKWMALQAAGKNNVEATEFDDYYQVKSEVLPLIAEWLKGKYYLYNNKYGFSYAKMIERIKALIRQEKLDMIFIDNLMALDISSLSDTELNQQKAFAWDLHRIAMNMDVHIVVVCHPKKPTGLLSRYDISGSSNLVNTFDSIIYCYRVNQEFKNYYKSYYGQDFADDCTNTLYVAKSRFGSVDDKFIPLWYEKATKRLLNAKSEYIKYGWDKSDKSATSGPFSAQEEQALIEKFKANGWLPKDYEGGFMAFDNKGGLMK